MPRDGIGNDARSRGVVAVVRQRHEHARDVSAHVLTTITIEDERGAKRP
jgi:hypothetical protein